MSHDCLVPNVGYRFFTVTYSVTSELNCGAMALSLAFCQRLRYRCRHGRDEHTFSTTEPALSSISSDAHVDATHFCTQLKIQGQDIKN